MAVVCMGVVQAAWWLQPLPLSLKALTVGLLALALARPAWALLVFAALGPVSTTLCHAAGSAIDGGWLFEQMALAVMTGALVRWPATQTALRSALPAFLNGAVALASMLAVLPARLVSLEPGVGAGALAANLWQGAYFARLPAFEPVFFGSFVTEGALLAVVVESLCRRHGALPQRLLQVCLLGQACAALLNLKHVVATAAQTGPWLSSLVPLLLHSRANVDYDVNAAGSVFLMIVLAGGAVLYERGRPRPLTAGVLALMTLALWLTGSRTAIIALSVVLLTMLVVSATMRSGRTRWLALAVAGLVVIGGVALVARHPSARAQPAGAALESRLVLVRTSWAMARSAPVFGVGVGTFWDRSAEFGAAGLLTIPGIGRNHENAHNNFLQVLAEEGLVGFIALMVLIGAIGLAAVRAEAAAPAPLRRWLLAGVAAFVLTWLATHPMLVRQPALLFWMFAGLLAAETPSPVWRRSSSVLLGCAALVLVSVPLRAEQHLWSADRRHQGIGVSAWHEGATRYRDAGAHFSLYLPATGANVYVPVRRAPGGTTAPDALRLRVQFAGAVLQEIRLDEEC
jgi:O-antigen ligase